MVSMLATNSHVSIPPRVTDYCPSDIRNAIWNCRGIAHASFLPPVLVVTDIRVGDDNARGILRRTTMNHDFTMLIGFIRGICIFGTHPKCSWCHIRFNKYNHFHREDKFVNGAFRYSCAYSVHIFYFHNRMSHILQ